MTPIDCRTCQDYDNGRCHNIAICHDGDLYMRAGVLRLYVVTEQQEKSAYQLANEKSAKELKLLREIAFGEGRDMSEKMRSEFEAWWPSLGQTIGYVAAWGAWQAAYLAGRASMREEAAKVCDKHNAGFFMAKEIRGIEP